MRQQKSALARRRPNGQSDDQRPQTHPQQHRRIPDLAGQAGEQSIEARYEDETVWLTQKLMAALFAVDVRTVSEHLKNIFTSGELIETAVIRKFRNTAADGKSYLTQFYNLDAIISVGYRVNSLRATQFRQWATRVLREFAIKGYVLDRQRMENGNVLGQDYFERQLAKSEFEKYRIVQDRLFERDFGKMVKLAGAGQASPNAAVGES